MTQKNRLFAAMMLLAAIALALLGCQEQRNDFNPVRVFCPGEFDPSDNRCRIETHGPED